MPYRVFLSHSSSDAPWVKYIAGRAQAVGVEAYLYEHDPQPGHLIAEKVKQAIARSDAVVVLLTRSAHRSAYVQQEIGFAEAKRNAAVQLCAAANYLRGVAFDGRAIASIAFAINVRFVVDVRLHVA